MTVTGGVAVSVVTVVGASFRRGTRLGSVTGTVAASVGALTGNDCWNRLRENLQVEGERPVVDVFHVGADPLLELRLATVDLPEARNARLDAESPAVPARVDPVDVAYGERPRPDQAHVAHEHVEELRKLVEAEPAKQPPKACAARILFDFEDR